MVAWLHGCMAAIEFIIFFYLLNFLVSQLPNSPASLFSCPFVILSVNFLFFWQENFGLQLETDS
jgi:hypothetical protein